jgi:hypothetical protein
MREFASGTTASITLIETKILITKTTNITTTRLIETEERRDGQRKGNQR